MKSLRHTVALAIALAGLLLSPALGQEEFNEETYHIRALRKALQSKAADLPAVAINTDPQSVSFQTLDLSQTLTPVYGTKNYALRFTVPDPPGHLVWAFRVDPGLTEWYIVPAEGQMVGFTHFNSHYLPADLPGVGSQGNRFIEQGLPAQRFKGAADYILWFAFKPDAAPILTLSLNMFTDGNAGYSSVFSLLATSARTAPPDPGGQP